MSLKPTKPSLKRGHKKKVAAHARFSHVRTMGDIEEYRLAHNGLRVLYAPLPGSQSVTVNVIYLVGSRHESIGKTGIAHMLEHMLFKDAKDKQGIRHRTPHKELERKGAVMNATTWTDRTHYYALMPAPYLADILRLEAMRMRGAILTPKEFQPEQQNVLSEYEMVSDRPETQLDRAVSHAAFTVHGYRHDTIGYREDIAGLTVQDLKTFYDKHYAPNNAVVVVAGDVTKEEVLDGVYQFFGDIPASTVTLPARATGEKIVGRHQLALSGPNPVRLLTYAFSAPHAASREWVVLLVAFAYLEGSKISPLYKKLIDTQICSSVSSMLYPSYDPSIAGFQATVSQGSDISEVVSCIERELKHLVEKPIKERDLVRVKNKLIADTLYARDGSYALASELTEWVAAGDWTLFYSILSGIQDVTPQDIQRVLTEYYDDKRVIIGTFNESYA